MRIKDEFTYAKIATATKKLYPNIQNKEIIDIYEKHILYKEVFEKELFSFDVRSMDKNSLNELNNYLEANSLIYSFSIDRFYLLPACICYLNFEVVVLLSEKMSKHWSNYFSQIIDNFREKYGFIPKIEFLTNTETGLLFKLKDAINKNKKVLIFVDGNKGCGNEKKENLFFSTLKNNPIYFHQGFGALSYLLRINTVTGIIVNKNEKKITFDYIIDTNLSCNISFEKYISLVSDILVNRLDRTISINNIHLWNNITAIYQWFIIDETIDNTTDFEYIPFELGGDYYAMEHSTFKAFQISKKDYRTLKKDLNMF